MFFDPSPPFLPCEYRCQVAAAPWELEGYRGLRREVFCAEQGLFDGDDADEYDAGAVPIVAVSLVMGMPDHVVGTVRIDHRGDGLWHGSRLTVRHACRGVGGLGAALVRKAVGTARAMGCGTFRAAVQRQNVPFFRRLRWRTLAEVSLLGRPHHLMEADLAFYPPTDAAAPIEVHVPAPFDAAAARRAS